MNPIYRFFLSGGSQTVNISGYLKPGYYDGTTGVYNPNGAGYKCAIFPATYGEYVLRRSWSQQSGARILFLRSDSTGGVLGLSLSGQGTAPEGTNFVALNFMVDSRITAPYDVPVTIRHNEQLPDAAGNWVSDPDRDITNPIQVAGVSSFRLYCSDGGNVVGGVCTYPTPGSQANGVTVGDYNNYIPEFIYNPGENDDHFICVTRRPGFPSNEATFKIEATPIVEPLPVPPDGWQYFTNDDLEALTLTGATFREVKPTYKDDLAKELELESNQRFYRAKLSGKINFIRDDYDFINGQSFDTEFIFRIEQSDDGGLSFFPYYTGKFMKTDCDWNADDKKVTVQPDVYDQYNDVLAGLEKEYNLIELAPQITRLNFKKRPLIQIYIPGDNVVSCFLSGMYWEQDANAVTDRNALVNTYYFALCNLLKEINVTGSTNPNVNGLYSGRMTIGSNNAFSGNMYPNNSNGHYIRIEQTYSPPFFSAAAVEIRRRTDDKVMYRYSTILSGSSSWDNADFDAPAVSGSGATGSAHCEMATYSIYARYLCDVEKIGDLNTYPLPTDDVVENNRNYRRAIGYAIDVAYISNVSSNEPTQWGIRDDGTYFMPPYSIYGDTFYPIARSTWRYASIWFAFYLFDWTLEQRARASYTLRDANPVSSVISVLLKKIAPGITHEGTGEYSQFLYGSSRPIGYYKFTLLLSQKSNVTKGDYDRPAQKAPVTLQQITNMLRDCFRCFWYIEDNKFKIEHVQFFRNGGSYNSPTIGADLTTLQNIRNGKNWGFATNKWSFEKVDMPERYQFEWMDDVTQGFKGEPIEVISKYVTAGKIETVNVSNFTSDVDYMILNPGDISDDGFALFAAIDNGNGYELPFIDFSFGASEFIAQNGLLAMRYLQPNFYVYDLPAYKVEINGSEGYAYGIDRKKKQTLNYPSMDDPDPMKLIKTGLGYGQVDKISVNLCSRMNKLTLKYDTE